MKKGLVFTFPKSVLSTNSASIPEDNPIRHLLPEEPYFPVMATNDKNAQKSIISDKKSQSNYDNMTLNYSPEIPISFQPKRQLLDTSPFRRNIEESSSKKYIVKPYDAKIEVKVISNSNKASTSHNLVARVNSKDKQMGVNQSSDPKKIFESVTYQEQNSKDIRKPENSIIKKLNFDLSSQSTSRQGKESLTQRHQSKESKSKLSNTGKEFYTIYAPQNGTLLHQIHELRSKLQQIQNLNATLSMQFQMSRQRLISKEAENQSLKQKNEKLSKLYEESNQNVERYEKMESQFIENRNLVNLFCAEIEQQKQEISLLSNKLNENEYFLQKEREAIEQRQEKVEREAHEYLIKLSNLQKERGEMQQVVNDIKRKNEDLALQIIRWEKNKEQMLLAQKNIEVLLKKSQDEKEDISKRLSDTTSRIKQAEKEIQTLKQELEKLNQKLEFSEETNTINKEKIFILQNELKSQRQNHRNEIIALNQQYRKEISILTQGYQNERSVLAQKYRNEINTLTQNNRNEISALNQRYRTQTIQTNGKHQLSIKNLTQKHEISTNQLNQQHQSQLMRQKERHNFIVSGLKAQIQVALKHNQELQSKLKQHEMELERLKMQYNAALAQIALLRQQMNTIIQEKQKMKSDIQQLTLNLQNMTQIKQIKQLEIDRFMQRDKENIEKIKQIELQLSSTIQSNQKLRVEFELKMSSKIVDIANKQLQIASLNVKLEQQFFKNNTLSNQGLMKDKMITESKQKVANIQKILTSYKEAMSQLKQNHELKWQQMKKFYEEQFLQLESQLREYSEIQNSKRSFKNFKKHILKQQTTIIQSKGLSLSESSKQNIILEPNLKP